MSLQNKKSLGISGDSPLMGPLVTETTNNNSIIQYGVGFDVHRDTISVCVAAQLVTGDTLEVKSHIFSAMPKGIEEITHFLAKYSPISRYLMECTGVYHLPLYHALKAAFPDQSEKVIAMNPLLLNRRITDLGKKTDHVDAKSLAFLTFFQSLIKPSYIGSVRFFRLRDMVRSYHKTQTQSTGCKNRIHRLLCSINAKMDLDLNAEWCLLYIDWLANSEGTIGEIYEQLFAEQKKQGYATGVLEKQRAMVEQISEIRLNEEDRFVLRMELQRMLREQVVAVEYLQRAEQYLLQEPALLHAYISLTLIPGLGSMGALSILLELGDYTRFKDWKAFLKFCGTIPIIEESGTHKVKGHVNRFSNKHIRYILTQSAGVVINRCDRQCDLGEFAFKQFKIKGLPFKKACIKVASKLAKTIYNVLILGVDYQPNYEGYERKRKKHEQYLKKNQTLLESYRTRALRRDINQFIGASSQYLNSSSRFQIVTGCHKMLQKAHHLESDKT